MPSLVNLLVRIVRPLAFFVLAFGGTLSRAETLDLRGTWRFALDRQDSGVREQWFKENLRDSIRLPGILQAQGFGDEISKETPWMLSLYDRGWYLREPYKAYAEATPVKIPFLAQPVRHYLGAAWYQRDLTIPENWRGRVLSLFLERTRWESTVWLDERKIGSENTLVASHEFELGQLPPGPHRLTIRVDNREIIPGYRPDGHAVSDSLGGTWNGITGLIELRATSLVALGEIRVFTDSLRHTANLEVTLLNRSGAPGHGTLSAGSTSLAVSWKAGPRTLLKIDVPLPPTARPWSEFDPALEHLTLQLRGDDASDVRELIFGVREFRTAGTQFLLNGRQIDLRGTHHGGDFPLTGYPPTDLAYWRDLFLLCRKWGLNHMRFHSWCPPEAAFAAADEVGFYLQPECGMWNDFDSEGMEQRLTTETEHLLRAYGNHPSFLLLSPSNEPGGKWKEVLPPWVAHFRALDNRHLYTAGTGWSLRDQPGPFGDKVDYLAVHRIGGRVMRGRPGWFGKDFDGPMTEVDRPNITHEVGQWCAYPNFDVIAKFTGYLQPGNYEIARDWAKSKGLLERNAELAHASGMFQVECYKEEIEANLRSKKLRGFQLLDLHDYLGQGTALVGLLDAFWQEKGYITAEQFRRFCSETVPLARLTKRVFTSEEPFKIPVEIAHFGVAPLVDATAYWKINDSRGGTLASGEWPAQTIPIGNGFPLGTVETKLSELPAPGAFRLIVGLHGTSVENDWNFWVYPAAKTMPKIPNEVRFTRSWSEVQALLARGEKVYYQPRSADLAWTCPPLDDVPIFWNRLMGPQWSRMLGLWCDTSHPALAAFPTDTFADWQWSALIRRARAINLDGLPRDLQPIVQAIDDWNRNYKLALVFECQVGAGRLLVSSIDANSADRTVAQQLETSLFSYMASDRFHPKVDVSIDQLRTFIFNTRIMRQLGATAINPSLATRVIDGDPNTAWFSGRPRSRPGELKRKRRLPDFVESTEQNYPHEFTLRFPKAIPFSGIVLMPRQDDRDHAGDIREYRLSISEDGQAWTEVSKGELPSSFEPKTLRFGRTVTARQLKFTALSGFSDDPSAALAELAVIYEGPPLETSPEDDGEVRYERSRSTTPEIDDGQPPRP